MRLVFLAAKQYHPDVLSGADSDKAVDEHFVAISEAYSILSNPALRSDYDAKRWCALVNILFVGNLCTHSPLCSQ